MAVALTQVVGLAYVVDSSLTVASEWSAILKDYMVPLLARVMENNHPTQARTLHLLCGSFLDQSTLDSCSLCLLWPGGKSASTYFGHRVFHRTHDTHTESEEGSVQVWNRTDGK